jgi:hypothetical protein
MKLLTREEFKELVFQRDKNSCVNCGKLAVDAHHILDRKLFVESFEKDGYFLENGVAVCSECHMKAETTELSCFDLREEAGITRTILPSILNDEEGTKFDKWGNQILPSGMRLKGPMFFEENVQKVLSDKMHLFSDYVKYPRTFHLPTSEKLGSDDKRMENDSQFHGKTVVCSYKLDGENTTMYRDHIHARSVESAHHPTRNWVKGLWSSISYEIPEGWRICGENLYGKHTIEYNNLDTYFFVYSIWNEKNETLPWEETKDWCELLGLKTVEVFYQGIYDAKKIEEAFKKVDSNGNQTEGFVVRNYDGFRYQDFKKNVAKFVRKDFVISTDHWTKTVEKNQLKS